MWTCIVVLVLLEHRPIEGNAPNWWVGKVLPVIVKCIDVCVSQFGRRIGDILGVKSPLIVQLTEYQNSLSLSVCKKTLSLLPYPRKIKFILFVSVCLSVCLSVSLSLSLSLSVSLCLCLSLSLSGEGEGM